MEQTKVVGQTVSEMTDTIFPRWLFRFTHPGAPAERQREIELRELYEMYEANRSQQKAEEIMQLIRKRVEDAKTSKGSSEPPDAQESVRPDDS
jgi:hypothetical protein